MSNMGRMTSWQQVQQSVKEAERLIARKEYNLVMVRTRQVLEYMVRCMAGKACVVKEGLSDIIGQLHEGQWINKATKDSYHTIRTLGNKAVHERDDTTYDANQAFQLLIQGVYVFANEFAESSDGRPARTSSAAGSTSGRPAPRQRAGGGRNASDRGGQRVPTRNTRSGLSRQGGPRKKHRRISPTTYMLRLLIPVLPIILLIVVIHVLTSDKSKDADRTTTVPTVTTTPVEPAPTLPPEPETEPETESPAETYKIKGSSIDVRSELFTSGQILVQLSSGTEVVYVKRYDNDWTIISYNDREAYVSSRYIEKVEPVASTGGETEGSKAQTVN